MISTEMRSELAAIERDSDLCEEINYRGRAAAIDYIEFNILDRFEGLVQSADGPDELISLKRIAERVKRRLETVDENLFRRLRKEIRTGRCKGQELKELTEEYAGGDSKDGGLRGRVGYDTLDQFINGLLLVEPVPSETAVIDPEMVPYQQTPARIIFELVEQAHLDENDGFVDLGSGLGQVTMLVSLFSGATARGIEFDPALCEYAMRCASSLNLSRVKFVNADARAADYATGTVFFMYTPFKGTILHAVLERLHDESRKKSIRLFTYGPCTPTVSRQDWLTVEQNGQDEYALAVFKSRREHARSGFPRGC